MTSVANKPWAMSLADWKQALVRAWKEGGTDNIGLIAAGVAFYAFLALVPLLGACVMVYGLIAEPETVEQHILALAGALPQSAAELIGEQLHNVVQQSGGKKGLGLLLALGIALFGARNAAGAAITAMNVAYDEEESRGFIRLNLLALVITIGGILGALLATGATTISAALDDILPAASGATVILGRVVSTLLFLLLAAAGAAALYRFGPDRDEARWEWISAGSAFAALGWVILTGLFGFYVANFGNYNATYGSLGAVVVLLTWLYLSAYVLLLGAEINAELERQTMADTTVGEPMPKGQRGAHASDTLPGEA
jgi:membrane protein